MFYIEIIQLQHNSRLFGVAIEANLEKIIETVS